MVYPTDTVYGLGADARSPHAVESLYVAKGRPAAKPISVAVPSLVEMGRLGVLERRQRAVLSEILPGPYTVILRSTMELPHLTFDGRIGLRMPGNPFSIKLCSEFPITCTSANLSGHPSPRTVSEVTVKADLVIDGGPARFGMESTVVDLSGDRPRILRRGAGQASLLERAIKHSGLPNPLG